MATSGTATFNLDISEIIEEAFDRAGIEARSGHDVRTARRSLNLLAIDWANRGIPMWTLEQATIPLIDGTATYALPEDTMDILEHAVRTTSGSTTTDIGITRVSFSSYATLPNKTASGRPVQIFVARKVAPEVTLWPVPDQTGVYTLVYWRMRRIEDAGNSGANTFDIPYRFLPCLTAGLAYYIAMKKPEAEERLPRLKADYEELWQTASTEDRDRASWFIRPDLSR